VAALGWTWSRLLQAYSYIRSVLAFVVFTLNALASAACLVSLPLRLTGLGDAKETVRMQRNLHYSVNNADGLQVAAFRNRLVLRAIATHGNTSLSSS
jgi:hypothetical protein